MARAPYLQKRVTAEMLAMLARLGCTMTEAAGYMGVRIDSLSRYLKDKPKLREAWDKGVGDGDAKLRALQWRHAQMANGAGVSMTIHMSKHRLGEHDRNLVESKSVSRVEVIHQLLREIDGTTKGLPSFPQQAAPTGAPEMMLLPDPTKVPESTE